MSDIPEGATHEGMGDHCKFWVRDLRPGVSYQFANAALGIRGYSDWMIRLGDPMYPLTPLPDNTWAGEGLPPVGTVCEFSGGTHCPEDPFDKDLKEGMKATIIAHFKSGEFTLAAFTFDPGNPDRGMVQVDQANFGCFRPIRTPEQIAAEERETATDDIHRIVLSTLGISDKSAARALYDAGYRKTDVQ